MAASNESIFLLLPGRRQRMVLFGSRHTTRILCRVCGCARNRHMGSAEGCEDADRRGSRGSLPHCLSSVARQVSRYATSIWSMSDPGVIY